MNLGNIATAACVTVTLATGANAASVLTNGGFETGDFTGWTATDATGSSGALSITTGGTSPTSVSPIPSPSEGTYYAVTDQSGPGAYSLTQSFVATGSMMLSFDFFAQTSRPFADLGTLDFAGLANQHARVDILTGAAGAFDVDASVIQNLIGSVANATPDVFASYSFDLSGLTVGETYQLRFAQVDNQGVFQMGVDNVSLTGDTVATVPVPAAGFLMIAGLGLLGAMRRQRKTA